MAQVINAELRGDYRVFVEFNDGTKGTIDFKETLEEDHSQFVRDLLDKEMFNTVKVDLDTLRWANEMDFCPDCLYKSVKMADDAGNVVYQAELVEN
ncbi:MAG: DUF2442 domain-containing protein [Chitinispirillia bacterium]|nr:DUF2442 domain-containing protein [Chitinispirillia bacterium]MCL2241817.1 DUF2442 domain-containing protein [Chitinispirillia bacterium]